MLRRDDNSVLRIDLDLELSGKKSEGNRRRLEKANGRGDRENWFEGGCPETRQVERRSASNCRRNVVNPAISAKGTIPDKN